MLSVLSLDPSPSASIESGYSTWSSSYLPLGAQRPQVKPDFEQLNAHSSNSIVKIHFRHLKKIVRWLSPRPFEGEAPRTPSKATQTRQHLEAHLETHCQDKPLPPVPSRLTSYSSTDPGESASYNTLNTPLTSQITVAHIASHSALLESGRTYSYDASEFPITSNKTDFPTFCTQSDLGHDAQVHAITPPGLTFARSDCPPSAFTYVEEGVKRQRKLTKRSRSTRTVSSSHSTPDFLDHTPDPVATSSRPRRRLTKRSPSTHTKPSPIEHFIVEPLKLDFAAEAPLNTAADTSRFASSDTQFNLSQTQASVASMPVFSDERPSFLRSVSNRRWTLAATESMPDEDVAAELERLRTINARSQPSLESVEVDATGINDPMGDWIASNRTVFLCRELLSTERRYLFNLERMYYGKTTPAPPQWLARYLPDLINVSRRILSMWECDASALAMSRAFLSCEGELEQAFSAWCGIVGELFNGRYPVVLTRSIRDRPLSDASHKQYTHAEGRPSPPALSMKATAGGDTSRYSTERAPGKKDRKFILRDAAIQPSQRVTRYTLLFKDLLHHTSSSSLSYQMVSNALESAARIAERCDHAQTHNRFTR